MIDVVVYRKRTYLRRLDVGCRETKEGRRNRDVGSGKKGDKGSYSNEKDRRGILAFSL